jgi:hypothetical protein
MKNYMFWTMLCLILAVVAIVVAGKIDSPPWHDALLILSGLLLGLMCLGFLFWTQEDQKLAREKQAEHDQKLKAEIKHEIETFVNNHYQQK